jgi:hypothetical protein
MGAREERESGRVPCDPAGARIPSHEGVMHYAPGSTAIACGTRPGKTITQRSTATVGDVTCVRCWHSFSYRDAARLRSVAQ